MGWDGILPKLTAAPRVAIAWRGVTHQMLPVEAIVPGVGVVVELLVDGLLLLLWWLKVWWKKGKKSNEVYTNNG